MLDAPSFCSLFGKGKNMKSLKLAVVTVVAMVLFSACSGGGGTAADPLASLPYTGATAAATLDSADIEEFMQFAYFAYSPLYSLAQDQGIPSSASPMRASAHFYEYEDGLCGGVAAYDLEVNENTGAFKGTMTAEGFDDCEIAMTGTIAISGQIDLNSGEISSMSMVFELLELTDNTSGSLAASGRFTVAQSGQNENITIDMRVRDEETAKVYWLDGYRMTVLYGYDARSFKEETISGRLYDPDRGYIDVSTPTPIRTYEGDAVPGSGAFVVEGATGASARLTFLSEVIYRVEADIDSDGVYEYDTGRVHYPGANTLPVADAGEDAIGNVGCTLELNGSNSSDADLDALQYAWTIASAPPGSSAQLANASSAAPSFSADLKGNYTFSLSIFDGYDTVVDTVDFTAYGNLFCLNDATLTPYGATDQYEAGVAVGDVTSDGRADVLALTQEAELHVFVQNPSGELAAPVMYTVDNWRAVAVGDVTGDGKNDAVVTTDAGVGVLAQNNAGTLNAMVEYPFNPPLPSAAYSYALALGDLNNDGRLDAAVLPEGGPVYVFLQTPTGTLVASSTHESAAAGWSRVIVGDVTADGLADIVLSRANTYGFDNIAVLPQSPSGGFAATRYYTIGNLPYTSTYPVILGDVNGDSRLDLVYNLYDSIDENATAVGILPQSAAGNFEAPLLYNAYYPPIYDLGVADVTGDGRDDLVVLHGTPHSGLDFSPTTVAVLAATGEGTLASYDRYPVYQTPQSWGGFAVGDVDGNGKNDVVITAHGCDEFSNCGPRLVILHGLLP